MSQPELFEASASPSAGPDVAYTPLGAARAIVQELRCRGAFASGHPCTIWEMHVGGGAFVRALHELQLAREGYARLDLRLLATDVDPAAPGLFTPFGSASQPLRKRHDALDGLPAGWPKPDWILGNPPWSDAERHLRVAMATARTGIAWVLPWSWLLPAARREVVEVAFPDEVLALSERVAFEGPGRTGGSPPRDAALYIWRRRESGSWQGRGLMRVFSHRTKTVFGGSGA